MIEKSATIAKKLPLCIDLDGTLILTDTTLEAFFGALKTTPLLAFQMVWWLRSGRGYSKHKLAERASLITSQLPYNKQCIAWLRQEKESGRKIYLVTGSNEKFARLIAKHVGLFDDVIASTHEHAMSGHDKAMALMKRFGSGKFAYAGNSRADLHVWQKAGSIIVVNASSTIVRAAKAIGPTTVIGKLRLRLPMILRAVRWHQWAKNILIFVPLLTAHQLANISALSSAVLAFISFSAMASAIYLMNDLVDLPADRQNPYKKYRPLASGRLPILTALKIGLGLGIVSLGIASQLPFLFLLLIVAYAAVNLAYSLRLKRIIGIDVIVIASLYVLRIFAGSAATGIATSPWLFVFAACIFLSLALVKRVSEVTNLTTTNQVRTAGRGYAQDHRTMLIAAGILSGIFSLVIFGFYLGSPIVQTLYRIPLLLWLLLPLFSVWIARVWKLTLAGTMHEDPTVFAAKDAISYTTAAAAIVIVLLAT